MDNLWNKCDECGQFISISSFESGNASRKLVTTDSYFSKEEYETLCVKHKEEKDENKNR